MTEPAEASDAGDRPSGRRRAPGPAYRLAALAARTLGFVDATVALVDGQVHGVMATTRPRRDLHGRTVTRLGEQVTATGEPLVVPDLSGVEPATGDQPAEPVRGAFVGVPLRSRDDVVVGVLYLTDDEPRTVAPADLELLVDFAAVAADQLELTRRANDLDNPAERGVAALVRAIRHGEIIPWYQPLVDLETGRVTGLEALARWEHSSGALDDPAVFIPLAERTNLIVDLDRAVARRALRDVSRWQQTHPDLRLSLNLSGRHFDTDDWYPAIRDAVERSGVDPRTVTLELTETVRPQGGGLGAELLTAIRADGFEVWFDDFGSGWAALHELLSLPLDGIKLDRAFVAELDRSGDQAVVRAITSAAHGLGLRVTIEGVETPAQAELAHEIGCDYGQGYLWSRPLPTARLQALLDGDPTGLPLLHRP